MDQETLIMVLQRIAAYLERMAEAGEASLDVGDEMVDLMVDLRNSRVAQEQADALPD